MDNSVENPTCDGIVLIFLFPLQNRKKCGILKEDSLKGVCVYEKETDKKEAGKQKTGIDH